MIGRIRLGGWNNPGGAAAAGCSNCATDAAGSQVGVTLLDSALSRSQSSGTSPSSRTQNWALSTGGSTEGSGCKALVAEVPRSAAKEPGGACCSPGTPASSACRSSGAAGCGYCAGKDRWDP